MGNNLKTLKPLVEPVPIKDPETQPIIIPEKEPEEDDPWIIPSPKVPPPPKA